MKSFGVVGLGRFGRAIALKLSEMGYEVLAVDMNVDKVNSIAPYVTQAIAGDAKDDSVFNALGLKNYDCIVVAITEDISASILITLHAKECGIEKIVCKAVDNHHKKILEKIGADEVVIPEDAEGEKMAVHIVSDNFIEHLRLSDEYSVIDMKTPVSWRGKTLTQLDIRKKHKVNVIAVKKHNEVMVNPPAEYVFEADDIVVMVGRNNIIDKIK